MVSEKLDYSLLGQCKVEESIVVQENSHLKKYFPNATKSLKNPFPPCSF